jgi:hypothetical protein
MSERFDLDDGEGRDDLEEALRHLQRGGRPGETTPKADSEAAEEEKREGERRRFEEQQDSERREAREGIEDALTAIRARQVEAAKAAPRRPWLTALKWSAFALIGVALVVTLVRALLPTPPPPPARSPEAAVQGFWESVISGDFEAAAYYYPPMVDRYGSRRQAALSLESYFKSDPPVAIASIGQAEPVPESEQLLVSYEVTNRSRRPRVGEAVVVYAEGEDTGYIVLYGI